MSGKELVGTGTLLRLAVRRDRLMPLWVLVLGVLPASTYRTYEQLYPTVADRAGLTATMGGSSTLVVMYGQPYDLTTAGGFTAWRMSAFLALFTGLLAVFTVVRHSRAEEESGRAELLAAGVVGRYALPAAALVTAAGAVVGVALVECLSLLGVGAPSAGAVAMGTGTAAVGIVFAAVAVVTAQLASFGRSANAMASSVLAVAYLLRAVGDGNGSLSWLSWMSPLSWATHLRAFAHERWWPLLLALAAVVGLLVAAGVLLRRRDVGSGVLEPADGAARAPARLSTSWALAWRLQRTSLLVWTIGVAVFGAALGSLAGSVADVMGDNADVTQIVRDMGGSSMLTDAFAALTVGMFGLIAAVYAVQAMLHARAEEAQGRAEPVLATGTTRLRWMSGHLVQSLAGSAVIVLVAGLTIGAAAGAASDVSPPRVLEGAALQLPAVWVFAGLACLLVGLLPRAVAVAWAAVGLAVGLWFFGPLLGLDEAVLDVSPFQHVPQVPGGEVTVAPLLALSCIAVALIAAGLVGFRRRDVA